MSNSNSQTKILITDDSVFMRKVLIDILKGGGYSVFAEAENGQQAIEKVATFSPDLVLLDIVMPELDGLGALKKIGQDNKVIIISAVGQGQMIEEARSLGAKGFIVKPFEEKMVLEKVKEVLEN